MPKTFHQRITNALADENLQSALDDNTDRRIQGRVKAFASLPDGAGMRHRAHVVRAEVIDHLDRYLEQFIAQVEAHGVLVHRAADAHQAVQIILEIARQAAPQGPVTIAKSKTMVSEEIHLNQAFEQAGMIPVETDLGEYIVQLRGEPPSHIITPAVHLRRQQVGQLFHEKLGVPYTEDIPEMTDTARRNLRQVFLSAQVGLSGVNFGVAETGTLVLMTNEGNGRMVTTVPPVHIALMGMERLVPNLDDLALLMALLPRSATGQKITVYASLIHSPRRPDEIDGPLARHLVILDNGRSAIRQTPLREILYCIRCGACLNACPVFREIGGHAYVGKHGEYSIYPGPIGSVLAPALFGTPEFGHLARASTLCGACQEACPVEIDLPKLLVRVRTGMTNTTAPLSLASASLQAKGDEGVGESTPARVGHPAKSNAPWYLNYGMRAYAFAAVHPRLFGLVQRLAGLGGKLAAPRTGWLRLPAFTGWGASKDFPSPAATPFHTRWNARSKGRSVMNGDDPSERLAPSGSYLANPPLSGGQTHGSAPITNSLIADSPLPDPLSPLPISPALPLLDRFRAELEALGGHVIACSEDELAGRVLALLQAHGVQAVMAWDESHLPAGLLDALQRAGIRAGTQPDPSLKVGITGALAGVAETGTLVLPSGAGRPLTASLFPEIHLAVLRAADLRENLPQVLGLRLVREASAVVLVSGPSRTGDIEMSLTIGVHGPGEVHVFVIGP